MIALRIEFLAGRFHANPWDRGTNEGEVEWPPSPWRMLRAITAGWHRSGATDRDTLLRLLDALAEPPVYYLPRATAGHSRHYVPLGGLKNGKPEKTLMLDSFLALESGRESVATAYVAWPRTMLDAEERALLERACGYIGYIGRAESWCAIGVVDAPDLRGDLAMVDLASRSDSAGPTVRRLAAGADLRGTGLLRSLSETTGEMRRARRLVPPGTAWVEYRLPDDYLLVREQYEAREREELAFGPTILRFTLERTASSVRPSISQAVSVAEVMRRAAMSRYSDMSGGTATTRLAGKNEAGSAKREGHDHPFYLPADSDGTGSIDRIDVWFPHGCSHGEYRAVTSIDALKDRFVFDGELALTFLGNVEPPRGRVWRTATPVVLDRFPKVRGTNGSRRVVDSPDEQLRAMMARRLDEPCTVEMWPQSETVPRRGGHGMRLDAFRRARRGERASHPVAGATLEFEQEVVGPIVLGRLAHFGLGQFDPSGLC
ncbi:MAG TPA: type I-U CRISPR-associated protein Csb2 [Candidatus Baltobacteraceae bacterium]|nr:type I-U CRISPR-associated protein Csb2 [Candidatus Baltobacteraceae bacterium]